MVSEKIKNKIAISFFAISAILSILILIIVISFIIISGYQSLSLPFLYKMWSHLDITKGGIFPAIIGTMIIGIFVFILSIPIGIITAIYLNEYAKDNILTRMIRLSIRNLAGVPSIVYGIFGFACFVIFANLKTSIISASLTLSCMTLPWIITASEESLKSVPNSFREGSFALGATKWQTIKNVILPSSMSGMLTGSILGISRAMGETAPIILVGATFYMDYLPRSIFDKFMALPYHLFVLATQHSHPKALNIASAVALVLIAIIILLNMSVFIIRYKLRKKKEW